jgi:hypothetical protein
MTKSRDQRCKRALNTFFCHYEKQYTLVKLNVRGYVYARYEITIPRKWTDTEPRYDHETGTLQWETNEFEQELPDSTQIRDMELQFRDKFQPYEKPDTSMRVYEVTATDENVVFKIIVHYFKSYIPFPEDEPTLEQRIGQLERINEDLNQRIRNFERDADIYALHILDRNNELSRRNRRLARDLENANNAVMHCKSIFHEHYVKLMMSYRKIIQNCFAEMGQTHECPICYEPIPNQRLFVTPCNHKICDSCASQCNDTCPMCRQEMSFSMTDEDINVYVEADTEAEAVF